MEITSAVELINQLIYKPDWKFTAEDHTNRFEGTVRVRVDYPARNSNRDQAAAGYPEEIMTYAVFPILVGDCPDQLTLYRRVLDALVRIETHEAREFLRVPGTNWAPFHPHRIDGMKAWHRTQGADALPELSADLQFGVA